MILARPEYDAASPDTPALRPAERRWFSRLPQFSLAMLLAIVTLFAIAFGFERIVPTVSVPFIGLFLPTLLRTAAQRKAWPRHPFTSYPRAEWIEVLCAFVVSLAVTFAIWTAALSACALVGLLMVIQLNPRRGPVDRPLIYAAFFILNAIPLAIFLWLYVKTWPQKWPTTTAASDSASKLDVGLTCEEPGGND